MEKRQTTYLELIGIIRHVLSDEPLPRFLHWDNVIRIATAHRLLGFVYRAVMGNEKVPPEVCERVETAYFSAVGAQVRRDHYAEALFAALHEREIPYMPIKGYCLRELYPQRNWRMAQDIDFLVSEEARESIAEILTPLGFSRRPGDDEDTYTLDRVAIRVHTGVPAEDVMKADGQTLHDLLVTEDGIVYRPTPATRYAALLSRMHRSFGSGEGIGIRSVLDLYMCRAPLSESERSAVHDFCNERGILRFASAMEDLADVWFGYKESTNDLMLLGSYIAAHGTVVGIADAEETNKTGRWRRVFPRYASMKRKYSVLRYLPFLLPLFWVVRWIALPFSEKAAESVTATEERRAKMLTRVREIMGMTASEATTGVPVLIERFTV